MKNDSPEGCASLVPETRKFRASVRKCSISRLNNANEASSNTSSPPRSYEGKKRSTRRIGIRGYKSALINRVTMTTVAACKEAAAGKRAAMYYYNRSGSSSSVPRPTGTHSLRKRLSRERCYFSFKTSSRRSLLSACAFLSPRTF